MAEMSEKLKQSLIERYRETIDARYQFDAIAQDKKFPAIFNRKQADELRTFFLENLYPDPQKRAKLDAAFERLEGYIKEPAKIWGILGNLTSAIFRYGFMFPKAIKAAIETLHTHNTARSFEALLVEAAQKRNIKDTVSEDQLLLCIADLPPERIEQFIDDLSNLFLIISDTAMLEKTISILEDVAAKMRSRKDLYDKNDVEAIMLGAEILKKGNLIMKQYNEEQKKMIVEFIAYNERKFVENSRKKAKKIEQEAA
ncbi:MAG: hypothetical protein RMJ53_09420 [Chitinophagales bacterium]|nr:hypothetical protein [Chitinophagales bacterium]MDW8274434.1 hypothetical protein [Chitinophagales bacterium]